MSAWAGSFLLDSEALSALARQTLEMQEWVTYARRRNFAIFVSAATLDEVLDGSARDAAVYRVLKPLTILPVTAEIGGAAGKLRKVASSLRSKPRDLTVDAIVAATACRPVVILTSDSGDFRLMLGDSKDVSVTRIG